MMDTCNSSKKLFKQTACVSLLAISQAASAGAFADWFNDISISTGGFIRGESAWSTDGENPNNQGGNYFNDQTVGRQVFLPPALQVGLNTGILQNTVPNNLLGLVDGVLGVPGLSTANAGKWGSVPLSAFDDEIHRGDFIRSTDNGQNYLIARGEFELGIRFTRNFRFVGRVRGVYDPTTYDEFDARSVDPAVQGRFDVGPGAPAELYEGEPNYFDNFVSGGGKHNPLEWTGQKYQVYLPAAVLEYNKGGTSFRLGNQQIAWGQSIFFRVFDLPNGLDLRRHSLIDRALEEFSDKRVPMLSARLTHQVNDNILFDGYAGKFQPTVFGNPNTPYNVIPTQFVVQDTYKTGGFDDEISYGFRLKGDYGQYGWQAAAVRRFNPEGRFQWTKSLVNKGLNGNFGNLVTTAYAAKLGPGACPTYDPAFCRLYADAGEALANSPFSSSPGGVYSADEWFRYAAEARLDGILGLNAAISGFDGSRDLYASEVETYEEAVAQLNTFFVASGGSLQGYIERTYSQENIFALGGSYVIDSANDFLNQLIVNIEVQWAPEREFTNITLAREPIVDDEYTISIVMDKWHRFFNNFPGTYIVFQALTKNRSDLVGRHLSGYGGVDASKLQAGDTRTTRPKTDNANYVVFGFTQPWPNKVWEAEFATLIDLEGGILAQPGVRWNPGKGVTVEAFYNYINGELWGNPNDNLISTLDFADEFTLRATYTF